MVLLIIFRSFSRDVGSGGDFRDLFGSFDN